MENQEQISNSPMNDPSTPHAGAGQQASGGPPPGGESASSAGERIQVIIEAAEKAAAGIIEDADAQARRYIDASRKRADVLAEERVRVMADLTDTLVRQAELVRRQSDELLAALDSARGELASRIGRELSGGGTPSLGGAPAGQEQPPTQEHQGPQGPRGVPHLKPVESERPELEAVQSPPTEAGKQQPHQAAGGSPGPAQQAPPPQGSPAAPQPPANPASGPPSGTPSDGARLLAAQMAVAGSSREEIEIRLRNEFGIQDAGPILDGILGPG
jgi:hypothetical protein